MTKSLRRSPPLQPITPRNQAIRDAHAAGRTLADIAREYGITVTRVRQIVDRVAQRIRGGY